MSSAGAGAAAAAAVEGAQRHVPPRRQLRHHRRHGAGHQLLRGEGAGQDGVELRLPAHPDQVAAGDEAQNLQLPRRVQGPVPAVAVHRGRVRRQRLQLAALRVPPAGGGARVRGGRRQLHRRGNREADRGGRRGPGGARGAADRLLPGVPVHLPEAAGDVRRQERVHQGPQHAVVGAQRGAAAQDRGAPEEARRRAHHVRRLLHAHHPVRPPRREMGDAEAEAEGVLRGAGRGGVQLQPDVQVRGAGSVRVRRPVQPLELGRHPPHGGLLRPHRQGLALRALRRPTHRRQPEPRVVL
uniref:Uncharacterized protein n=1 Tax=Aegilops tauschii subsp. strangulata TaxID=200361 RepID=A0A453EE92_AEGTS